MCGQVVPVDRLGGSCIVDNYLQYGLLAPVCTIIYGVALGEWLGKVYLSLLISLSVRLFYLFTFFARLNINKIG